MSPDLQRLIQLQELDTAAENARRRMSEMPARIEALEARLADRREALEHAKVRLGESQTARRAIEKDMAAIQSRLSKFRDQLMEVKTNKEYQAMQKEIAVAEREVRGFEDHILERMLEADEITASVKLAEADLASEQSALVEERRAIEQESAGLEKEIEHSARERARVAAEMQPQVFALFEHVARGRKGVAVAAVQGGHCSYCHVRLRPQAFNEVQRNESIIQCESCQRILYFVPAAVT